MTPIRSTFQLRPGLKYLDKIDEKQKNANKKAQVMDEEDANNEFSGGISIGNKQPNDDIVIGSTKAKITGKAKVTSMLQFLFISTFILILFYFFLVPLIIISIVFYYNYNYYNCCFLREKTQKQTQKNHR